MKPILPKTSACISMPQIQNVLAQPGTTIILTSVPGSQNLQHANTSVLLPSSSTIMLGGPVAQQPASLILPLKAPKATAGNNRQHPPLLAPKCLLPKVEPIKAVLQSRLPKKKPPMQAEEAKHLQSKDGVSNENFKGIHQGSTVKSILPKVAPADGHTVLLLPARTPDLLPSTFQAVLPPKMLQSQEGNQKSAKRKRERKRKPHPTLQKAKDAVSDGIITTSSGQKQYAKKDSRVEEMKINTIEVYSSTENLTSKRFLSDKLKSEDYSVPNISSATCMSTTNSSFRKQNLVNPPPPPYPKSPRNISSDIVMNSGDSEYQNHSLVMTKEPQTGFQVSFPTQFNTISSRDSVKSSSASPLYTVDAISDFKNCPKSLPYQVFSRASSKPITSPSPPASPVYAAPVTSQPKVTFSMMQHDTLSQHMSPPFPTAKSHQPSSSHIEDRTLPVSSQPALPSYSMSSSLPQINASPSHPFSSSIPQMVISHSHSSSNYSTVSSPLPETSSSLDMHKESATASCFSFHTSYEALSEGNQPEHQSPLSSIPATTEVQGCNQSQNQSIYSYSSKSATFRESPQPFTQASFYSESQHHMQSDQYMHSPYQSSYINSPGTFSHSAHEVSYAQSPQTVPYTPSSHTSLYGETSQSVIYSDSQASAYEQSKFFLRSENVDSYTQSPQPFTNSVQSHQSPIGNGHQSPQPASFSAGQIATYTQSPQQIAYCNSPQTTPVVQDSPDISHLSILPSYSSSEHASQYLGPSTPSSSTIYNTHHTNLTLDTQVCNNKTILTSASYSTGRVACSGTERSHNPPSYEAHFQNTTAYTTQPSHTDPDMSQHITVPPLQTSLPTYPMPCHSPQFLDQGLVGMHVEPRPCVKSPPAYPSSPSLPPPPPPSYTSNPHLISTVQSSPYPANSVQGSPYPVTSTHDSYTATSNINNSMIDYSVMSAPTTFFPSDPPEIPPPAAPPPVGGQSCLTQTSQNDGFSGSMPPSSFPSALYLPPGDTLQDFEHDVLLKSQNRIVRSAEHKQCSQPSELKGSRRNGVSGTDNSQVHNIIERAERLWFIPHQEQNRAYIKRKEIARDFLNSSDSHSDRDTLLKEKFWIEEDEPIAEEIAMSAPASESTKNEEIFASTSKNVHHKSQLQEAKTKKKQSKEMLCQVCGKMLKGHSSLKSHLNSHQSIQPHSCIYCPKSFKNRSVLVAHLRIHTGERPYVCRVCDKAFRTFSRLHRHKSMHSNDRPHKCSVCSKSFKTKLVLQQHLKLHITGLFTCSDCGKTFERHRSLSVHKASHYHNSQRFPCPHCPKSYHFQSLLNNHMQAHSDVQKHVCSVCGKAFVWRSGLAAHMKSHSTSRPQCEVCGMRFASKKRLETHSRRHGNPKPHRCDICGRCFSHPYRLASHKLVHQEHTNYSCPKCGVVLSSGKKFRKHLAEHSKEEPRICPLSGTVEITKSG